MNNFKEYKYDLSLENDGSSHFLTWIIACLFYVAALSLIASQSSKVMINTWQNFAENQITIEIPQEEMGEIDPDTVLNALKKIPAVNDVDIITSDETVQLIKPILGIEAESLPLPTLVNITLEQTSNTAIASVKTGIRNLGIDGTIQFHEKWAGDILSFGRTLHFGAQTLLILMIIMAVLTIVWALSSRVSVHRDEIEILTTIGADDSYIASQLQHFALMRTIFGCAIGFVLAIATVLLLQHYVLEDANLMPLGLFETVAWLFAPMLICIVIALFSAHVTLARTLSDINA
jgi:cell division transport system permease protein